MEEVTSINVYSLNWNGLNICNTNGDGLWQNDYVLAIHWPTFSSNFLNDEKFTLKHINKFYYNYNENDTIRPINFNYFAFNDIVTKNFVWDYYNKINIYYEVVE